MPHKNLTATCLVTVRFQNYFLFISPVYLDGGGSMQALLWTYPEMILPSAA